MLATSPDNGSRTVPLAKACTARAGDGAGTGVLAFAFVGLGFFALTKVAGCLGFIGGIAAARGADICPTGSAVSGLAVGEGDDALF